MHFAVPRVSASRDLHASTEVRTPSGAFGTERTSGTQGTSVYTISVVFAACALGPVALAGLGRPWPPRGALSEEAQRTRHCADVVQMSCRCRASCPVTSCDLTRLPYQPYQPYQPWIYQPWIMLQMLQAVSRDQPTGQSSCLAGGVDAVLRTLGISCHTGYWYLGKSWNEFD